jgi:hypothetical protein
MPRKTIDGVVHVGPEDVLAKIGSKDYYIGAENIDRNAVIERLEGDDTKVSKANREAAVMAMVEAQTAALALRIDRHSAEMQLLDAEMRLRTAQAKRELGAVKAFEARDALTRDIADGKVTREQRLALRGQGERAAMRARDRS